MGDIIQIACRTLTTTEDVLYKSVSGVIIKSIIMYNSSSEENKVTITLDGVPFTFLLSAGGNTILNVATVTREIKAQAETSVNINISGIELR